MNDSNIVYCWIVAWTTVRSARKIISQCHSSSSISHGAQVKLEPYFICILCLFVCICIVLTVACCFSLIFTFSLTTYLIKYLLTYLLTDWMTDRLTHSLSQSLICLLIYLLTHSLTQSLTYSDIPLNITVVWMISEQEKIYERSSTF